MHGTVQLPPMQREADGKAIRNVRNRGSFVSQASLISGPTRRVEVGRVVASGDRITSGQPPRHWCVRSRTSCALPGVQRRRRRARRGAGAGAAAQLASAMRLKHCVRPFSSLSATPPRRVRATSCPTTELPALPLVSFLLLPRRCLDFSRRVAFPPRLLPRWRGGTLARDPSFSSVCRARSG